MGKRELLLIVAFAAVGAVVYQVTAEPAGPNDRSFSLSRLLDHVRRELRGNPASAETTITTAHAVSRDVTELRLAGRFAEVQITGEDRADVETTLKVHSNAMDDAEAKRTAEATVLLVDRPGAAISFQPHYPVEGRQRAFLTIKVPARLQLRLEQEAPSLVVTKVAAADVPSGRFQMSFKDVAGRLAITHRGGELKIENVGALKLSGRGTSAAIDGVRGDASITMQGGELEGAAFGGPVDIEATGCDITIGKAERTRGPIRINATSGNVALKGLRADARIDGRNVDIAVVMAAPAPVAIYNEGDERIALTPPPGGYTLDALAANGRITLPEDLKTAFRLDPQGDVKGERAAGTAGGGGPTITLRSNHGNITILSRESLESQR